MRTVQVGQKTQSNGKSFSLFVKQQPLKCKIYYTFTLPSNHFQFYLNRERERELLMKEREDAHLNSSSTPPRFVVVQLTSDQAQLFLLLPLSLSLFLPFPPSANHVTDLPLSLSLANQHKSSNPLGPVTSASRSNHQLAHD